MSDSAEYQFFPQLDLAISGYWNSVEMVKTVLLYQSCEMLSRESFSNDSIFDLLLNPVYPHEYYNYLFVEVPLETLGISVAEHLSAISGNVSVYVSTDDTVKGQNVLGITAEEIQMLDRLLTFRRTLNVELDDISVVDLTSELSKLIYWYMKILGNRGYEYLNDLREFNVSDERVFVKIFNFFVLNEIHNYILGAGDVIEGVFVPKYMYRADVSVSQEVSSVSIGNIVQPVIEDMIFVFLNGSVVQPDEYHVEIDTDNDRMIVNFFRILNPNSKVTVLYYSTSLVRNIPAISSEVVNQAFPTTVYLHRLVF